MTSQYEKSLAENYRRILKHGRTSNIKKLNHTKKPKLLGFFSISSVTCSMVCSKFSKFTSYQ